MPVPRTFPPARQRPSLPLWGRWHGVSRDGRGSSPSGDDTACQKTALARQRPRLPEGSSVSGSDSPPGCHSLPLTALRLPLCKGSCHFLPKAKMTEGLLQYNVPISPKINAYFSVFPRNPSAPSGHLPLHKGGFGAVRFYTFLLYNRLL